jgi:membrane protein implicated in regulation of membrane protease activity
VSKRTLRWEPPERPIPKRPYRDTVLVYGGMAIVVVVLAAVTGGSLVQALAIALAFFVIATLWSWRTWRHRLRDQRRRQERE